MRVTARSDFPEGIAGARRASVFERLFARMLAKETRASTLTLPTVPVCQP